MHLFIQQIVAYRINVSELLARSHITSFNNVHVRRCARCVFIKKSYSKLKTNTHLYKAIP